MIAMDLENKFFYTTRIASHYQVPSSVVGQLRGQRIAVVDDVINAGSAVQSTATALESCGAEVVAMAALLTLGGSALSLARHKRIPLETIASLDASLWEPASCPLCASGAPLEDLLRCESESL
jgi:orotate phosphoribosyltransferase